VHHAFLFCGARGVGKTTAARVLAKALCCEKGVGVACGVCSACVTITDGSAVDYHEIDGASNNSVDDIRELRDGVRYQPAQLKRKIYVIDEVHMLSTAAFNALLKTLEEPPPHVTFIFATTEVHKIPVTILSRCQRFDFKLISTARLAEHLDGILRTEKIEATPDAVRLIARQAAGSVRDALSLLDQAIAYVAPEALTAEVTAEVLGVADRRLLVELAGAALDRDAGAALRLVARAADRGVDFGELGRSFLGFLRDLEVIARVSGGQGGKGGVDLADLIDATPEEIEEARAIAGRAAPGLFPVMFDRWARAVDEASRLPTPRLLFEMAALDLCAAEPMMPLGDLLQRLDELEARLRGAPRAPGAPAPSAPPAPAGSGGRPKAPSGQRTWAAPAEASAPPPPAAPPPAAAASGSETVSETWRRVMTAFEAKGPRLASLLAHAEVVSLKASELTLAFEAKRDAELADKARGEIEQGASTTLGRSMKVTITVGAPAAAALRSEVGSETDAANADRQNREAEARQHPVIRRAQDLFGAALKEIKTP
jgi:DNA polymerase-3 subunit gamma/tau